jgi:pimeloyl-ACP methyl ester carboxylesterase
MQPVSGELDFRNARIGFTRWEQGPEWLVCLHGYGEDRNSFAFLVPYLSDNYSVLALDLPFHGSTDWKEGLLMEPADLLTIIRNCLPDVHHFSLLGYSMGGRLALHLLQLVPENIRRILLIAPDGLHHNPWQRLATGSRIGNRLFAATMNNPSWLLRLAAAGAAIGIYDKKLLRFVRYYLNDAAEREYLYIRWTCFRRFRPDAKKIAVIAQECPVQIKLLFGQFDPVILSKHGIKLSRLSKGKIVVAEAAAGHQLLKEKYAPLMAALLKP